MSYFKVKMHQIRFRLGLRSRSRLQRPQAQTTSLDFKGLFLRGEMGMGWGGKGSTIWENWPPPGHQMAGYGPVIILQNVIAFYRTPTVRVLYFFPITHVRTRPAGSVRQGLGCFYCKSQQLNIETNTIQYKTIQTICNAHNVCQSAESETLAVAGGNGKSKI